MLIPLVILIYIIVIAVGSKKQGQSPSASKSAVARPANSTTNPATDFKNVSQSNPWDTHSPSSLTGDSTGSGPQPTGCFPALGFEMPKLLPKSTTNWWCDMNSEYAFMGFSYEVTTCQSLARLKKEFSDIRDNFNGRYIRIYGACDRKGFYNDIIEAAWFSELGLHALIWFGFDGSNIWTSRRDNLIYTLRTNPKAKFVVRALQFGSEPLYDNVMKPSDLAAQVVSAQKALASTGIQVTVSEMAYGYQARPGSQAVLNAVDIIDAHMLPFFSAAASTAKQAWPIVKADLDWFIKNGGGKKLYLSQNGWPSVSYPGVEPNSPNAVADIQNEKDYYELLDEHCSELKTTGRAVGWFAHLYSDYQEPGYGILDAQGRPKFPFKPRTSC